MKTDLETEEQRPEVEKNQISKELGQNISSDLSSKIKTGSEDETEELEGETEDEEPEDEKQEKETVDQKSSHKKNDVSKKTKKLRRKPKKIVDEILEGRGKRVKPTLLQMSKSFKNKK